MPVDRQILEENLARVNVGRRKEHIIQIAAFSPQRFTLSFANREMPEGQCIDQDFTDIQFALHENAKIDTGIQAGRLDEEKQRYFIDYEVIEWD